MFDQLKHIALLVLLFALAASAQGISGSPPTTDIPTQHQSRSIAIQAKQGTPSGPGIGVSPIEIDLIHQGLVIKTINAQLDEYGIAVIDDLPTDVQIQPIVRLAYAGVNYEKQGELIGPLRPQQTITLTYFELTSEPPDWTIPMRQIMLSYAPEGMKITEILVVMNPEKRTWLGLLNSSNRPTSIAVSLPERAKHVILQSGFTDWTTTSFKDGILRNHLPLKPHITEMSFSYIIPFGEYTYNLELVAPAPNAHMIVMLPDDISIASVNGMSLGGTRQIADTTVRYYTASDLSSGDLVQLSLSGLHERPSQIASKSRPTAQTNFPILPITIGVFVLAGGALLFNLRTRPGGA
jgi:hypothetical protein